MKKLLAPSLLSADMSCLKDQISLAERGGADWLHCDVMDGVFVPNITFGPFIVEAAKRVSNLPLDVHLMIVNPDAHLDAFAAAGADYLTVHQEACVHLHRTISRIRQLGVKPGVVINPATPFTAIQEIAEFVDLVLIMSVNPGFGGQKFIPSSLRKIELAAEFREKHGLQYLIETDGGISTETIVSVSNAGCDVFVAGNAVFGKPDIPAAIQGLKMLL